MKKTEFLEWTLVFFVEKYGIGLYQNLHLRSGYFRHKKQMGVKIKETKTDEMVALVKAVPIPITSTFKVTKTEIKIVQRAI